MDLDEAIHCALSGRAILFTGAGFSHGAINLRDEPFKKSPELAEHFAKLAGLPPSVGLEDAAEEFIVTHGPDALMKELHGEFKAKKISSAHLEVGKVPWKRIYTTNYDDIIETAYTTNGRVLTSVTLSDRIRSAPKESLCVHLNGYVGRLSRETVTSEIKLTDTSYLTASVAESHWAVLFRQDLVSAEAIFFVGYSMWDLDLRRIVFETENLTNKCFFILGPAPDLGIERRAARFGTALKLGIGQFGDLLQEAAKAFEPPDESGPIPYCIQKYDVLPSSDKISDKFIFELLLLGNLRSDFVGKSLHGEDRYCMIRKSVDNSMQQIDSGRSTIVIHSGLGNGKTVALETLKRMSAEKGYVVYTVYRRSESLFDELEQAFASPSKKVFVIDNYPDWQDVLEFFGTHPSPKTSLVLSARTSAHDVLFERAADLLKDADVCEIEIDYLTPDELEWVIEYFDEYGLWGDMASWSRYRKLEYLTKVCGAEWHAILIKLLESPQIRSRLQGIFEKLRGQSLYAEVIVSILVLTVMSANPSPNMLIDLCGQSVLETAFRRDPAIRELIEFGRDEIRMKSSVTGEFMLQRIVDPNLTVKVLVSLAKAADKAAHASKHYFGLLKSLMRFNTLQSLLPEKDRRRATLTYYESIKGLDHAKMQPLFWLQYAIASLIDAERTEEFERAEKYFKTAYSLAEARDQWDSVQIDNHYARFLLKRATAIGDVSTCMTAFRSARKLIHNQIERERLHYGYRVASLYWEFYEKLAPSLQPQAKDEIKRAAKHVCDRIEKLPPQRQDQRYVHECWDLLQKLIHSAI